MTGVKAFLFVFFMMPVGHAMMILINKGGASAQVIAAIALTLAGIILIAWTRRLKSEVSQSAVGVIGGILLWTGAVEYGFLFAKYALAVKDLVVDGQTYTLGEYRIMEHTWGLALIVMFYLLYHEDVRCNMFLWLRRKLRLMSAEVAAGRVVNYGPRVAFEIIVVMWVFYVILLLCYDRSIFGPHHPVTYAVFMLSLGCGTYLFFRLFRIKELGYAMRYAIPTVVIFWNGVEILAKWGVFREPWVSLNIPVMGAILAAFALSTYLIVHHLRSLAQG